MYIEIKWQKCIKAWKLAIWSNVKSRSEKKEKIHNVKKRSKWRNREKFWNFSFENWLAALIAAAADYWLAGVSKVLICGFQFIFFNGRYDFSHFSLLSHHFFFSSSFTRLLIAWRNSETRSDESVCLFGLMFGVRCLCFSFLFSVARTHNDLSLIRS